MNGKVVHTQPVKNAEKGAVTKVSFEKELRLEKSGWIALRVQGPDSNELFDGPAFAHTSPVYVQVADQPIRSKEDAAYFVEWIDQLIRVVTVRNGYKSADDRKKVEAIFRKAQDMYRKM